MTWRCRILGHKVRYIYAYIRSIEGPPRTAYATCPRCGTRVPDAYPADLIDRVTARAAERKD